MCSYLLVFLGRRGTVRKPPEEGSGGHHDPLSAGTRAWNVHMSHGHPVTSRTIRAGGRSPRSSCIPGSALRHRCRQRARPRHPPESPLSVPPSDPTPGEARAKTCPASHRFNSRLRLAKKDLSLGRPRRSPHRA